MLSVCSYEEAISLLKKHFARTLLSQESVNILESLGGVLQEDLYCPEDTPSFHRSTMDGYAVKAADTFGASASLPAMLEEAGEVRMGTVPGFSVGRGQAAHIPTGGILPEGTDSVVMVEYTEKMDEGTVLVEKPVAPWENVIQAGEDIKKGDVLFKKGRLITPQDIGALSSLGIGQIKIAHRFKVGIISTGNEITFPFEAVPPGKIRDTNSYALAASLRKDGMEPVLYGIVEDTFEDLQSCLKTAVENTDIVLLSGGSSVGIMDMTFRVIQSLADSEIFIHGVAVKPGKPVIAARVGDKAVIGLPGHPVSAFVVYQTIVSRFIKELSGDYQLKGIENVLFGENYASAPGRDEFVMVRLERDEGGVKAFPVYGKSGMMVTMAQADGYVHIPSKKEGLYKDERITVQLF